jgi:glutaminyl-tRNA synthetase
VSAAHALPAEVRLYDRLLTVPDPAAEKEGDFKSFINPHSLEVLTTCRVEPSLAGAAPGGYFQFERLGYFCVDPEAADSLVFNRTVTIRDPWAKIQKAGQK